MGIQRKVRLEIERNYEVEGMEGDRGNKVWKLFW